MALDLANGYIRKDGSSASNVYYGYSYNQNAGDNDKVFAIRRVNTVGGVETVTWANGSRNAYVSNWANRADSFATPGGSLNISSTNSTIFINSLPATRVASFTWSEISGVDKYLVTSKDESGKILNVDGSISGGFYVERQYTTDLYNLTSFTQNYINSGTYTFTVTAINVAGSTTSTVTINFPQ